MNKPVNSTTTATSPNLKAIIKPYLGVSDTSSAEQSIGNKVRADYRRANPNFGTAEVLIEEYAQQIQILRDRRDRRNLASRKAPLNRVPMPGARAETEQLTRHDYLIYILTTWAAVLGIAVAWHALASFVADSGVIESLTDSYWRSFLMSGVAVTGAVLFKAGAALCADEEEERAYYRRLFKYAAAAVLLYVAVLAATFGPHKTDLAAIQLALAGGGAASNPVADAIKAIAPYFVVGTQLLAEMLSAPVIFNAATQKHLAGRKIIVAEHDVQSLHESKIEALNTKIVELAHLIAASQSALDLHTDAQESEIQTALDLYRRTEAERARHMAHANDAFISECFGGT